MCQGQGQGQGQGRDTEDPDLCLRLIRADHDAPIAGHPGRDKTYELLSRKHFWPFMRKDVERFVANCHTCKRIKPRRHAPHETLLPLPVPDRPWQDISMDFVVGLPESDGFDAIWVVVDRLSSSATSSHAPPPSPRRVSHNSSWITCSSYTACRPLSSRTAARNSPSTSGPTSATTWGSSLGYQPPSTPRQMGRPSGSTLPWRNTFAGMSTTCRTIGRRCLP